MNVLNRAIVIILLVILIVLLPVLITLAMTSPESSLLATEAAIKSLQTDSTFFGRLVFSVIAFVLFLICLLLLWFEVRRPRAKAVQVQEIKTGEARVSIDSIVQRLEYNIDRLQDVISVRPVVKGKSNGVDVVLNLQTSPEIDVPMKTEEVVQLAREVVEDQMGLKLHNVNVEIKHAPYPEQDAL